METWLIVVLTIVIILLALIAVAIIRAFTSRSRQVEVNQTVKYPVDIDAAAGRLAEAIRFKTVTDVGLKQVDYAAFRGLHEFLQKAFPLVHSQLEKKVINQYGLVYIWKGSDPSLKPAMLIGHQDVVPAHEENWKYPPFSGAIEEGYIWGRGTLDDKSCLLGILEALEHLLREGYRPSRSIYLVSGFDEEVGGSEGAGKIADYFREEGIRFEYVLDEGMLVTIGATPGYADWTALIGLAEKGYVSLELSTEQKGGHASSPPPQTTVGILSAAIVKLQDNPFPMRFTTPMKSMFATLGPELKMPNKLIFANLWLFGPLIMKRMAATAAAASLRTTTAPTMFSGSPQDNVLPMRATAVINFRILQGDTTQSVIDRVTRVINDPRIKITPLYNNFFEPSPVSTADTWVYKTLCRTIRETLGNIIVIPMLVPARTDSIYFAGMSDHCYRFLPVRVPNDEISSVHGYNERISVNNYAEMINFYIRLVHNTCD